MTVAEREVIIKKLTNAQLKVLNTYKRYKYNSAFHQNNYLRNSDWQFHSFNEDSGYERSKGNRNLLQCECGKGLKYQFILKSKKSGATKKLGIAHFSQHLGIPIEVANEVKKGFNRIDLGMDEVLRKFDSNRSFPQEKYEMYLLMGLSDSSHQKLDKIFEMCSKVNLPLANIDEERMDKMIALNKDHFSKTKLGKRLEIVKRYEWIFKKISSNMNEKEQIQFQKFILEQDLMASDLSFSETKDKLLFIKDTGEKYLDYQELEKQMREIFDDLGLNYAQAYKLNNRENLSFFERYESYRNFTKDFTSVFELELVRRKGLQLLSNFGSEYIEEWENLYEFEIQAPKNISLYRKYLDEEWLPKFKKYYSKQKRFIKMCQSFPKDKQKQAEQFLKNKAISKNVSTFEECLQFMTDRNRKTKKMIADFLSSGKYIEMDNRLVISPSYKKQQRLERIQRIKDNQEKEKKRRERFIRAQQEIERKAKEKKGQEARIAEERRQAQNSLIWNLGNEN